MNWITMHGMLLYMFGVFRKERLLRVNTLDGLIKILFPL